MIKFGQVTEYDAGTGTATIEYSRPEACEKCGACGSAKHSGKIMLKAQCKAGDWVRVELPDGRFVKASVLAYALPFAGLVAGILAGWFLLGQNELITALCAFAGMAAAFLIIRLADRRIRGKAEWTPRVTAVYEEKPEMDDIGCGGM